MSDYTQRLVWCLGLLAFALTFIHYTDLDIKFQSLFFIAANKTWFVDRDDLVLKFVFYKFPKILIITYGIFMLLWLIKLKIENKNKELQAKLLFLVSTLILIPLTVAILKHYSPIHCPAHIINFGGSSMHISPLDIFKEGVFFGNNGKCFPAGHASGGFSLIALYFVMPTKRKKIYTLFGAIILGSIMGLYQMAKGVHYLSDTTATFAIAYLVCITMQKIILEVNTNSNS